MAVIDSTTLQRADEYARQFQTAKPFRHVVIDGFLARPLCERLLADFPEFESRHALNERGEVGGKAVRMDVRDISEAYRELDRYLQTPEFLGLISTVTGIPDLMYDPDYAGGGTHENRQGQMLAAHVDFNFHPRTHWHRRLNLIVYLNPEWEQSWGGSLELHSDPWNPAHNQITQVLPLFNKAVVFETTETSWHGFSRIQLSQEQESLSRKSFAIYLYTADRPAQETSPSHATVYVPESLPADWKTGHVLTDDDVHEASARFKDMRGQLRFLYEREKQFSTQIGALEHALAEAREAQRLEIQGYAIQPEGARGVWPDRWAGQEVSVSFVPTRDTRALRLELWAPPQIPAGQHLRFDMNGTIFERTLPAGQPATIELPLRLSAGKAMHMTINATHHWMPGSDDSSSDVRALAYRILNIVLEH